MVVPIEEGGGKGPAIKEKIISFTFLNFLKVPTDIKLEARGGKGLNGTAIKKTFFFCGFPYHMHFVKILKQWFGH